MSTSQSSLKRKTLGLGLASLLFTVLPPAQAQLIQGLKRVGPIDPLNGFPMWYEDMSGLKLGLCTDLNSCFFAPPDLLAPVKFPAFPGDPAANFPDEAFYWAGESLMVGASIGGAAPARAILVEALEGAFFNGLVVDGDQVVFSRIRIRIDDLTEGVEYTVHYPYGSHTFIATADAGPGAHAGPGLSFVRDLGIGNPGEFAGALNGDIGPFLVPTGFNAAAALPGDFIADGGITLTTVQNSPHTVDGGPANFFRIEGVGVGLLFPDNVCTNILHGPDPTRFDDCAESFDFAVVGQLANHFGVTVDAANYTRNDAGVFTDVWTSSASGQDIMLTIDGGLPVVMTERGASGNYFARVQLPDGSPRPLEVVVQNISDQPTTTVTSAISDVVTVQTATFTIDGGVQINAQSSDNVGSPQLNVSWTGVTGFNLTSGLAGSALINMAAPAPGVPPSVVRVISASGGVQEFPVTVLGLGTTPGNGAVQVLANAGPDQSVLVNTNVALSGGDSIGPVVSYSWTHDAGALISLSNPLIANPTFTTPLSLASSTLAVNFTLTVSDALGVISQDSVVVTITDPAVVPSDVTTILVARYRANKEKWKIDGECQCLANQVVRVYLGAPGDTTRFIGGGFVDANGLWAVGQGNGGAVDTGTVPLPTDTTVWAISELGGTLDSLTFTIN